MNREGWMILGAVSAVMGIVLGLVALGDLLSYSPYENPGAEPAGLLLGGVSAILIFAVPVCCFGSFVVRQHHAYRMWKLSLPPQDRIALEVAEAAGMMGAHLWWAERNRKTGAELTASVMGDAGAQED